MTAARDGQRLSRKLLHAAALIALLAAVVHAWQAIEVDFGKLAAGLPRMAEFLGRMVPPDATVAETVLRSTLETVEIALLGTLIAMLLSLPLGLASAENLTPSWIHQPVKSMLAVLRSIPLILLALFLVSTLGLGPFPGMLAIALHSTGMLAKFYAEAMENARPGPVDALRSAGASWAQRVRFAVLPQVAPDLVRDSLFRFELNLRESLVLGLVGAGGIGFYIQLYIRSFQYEKVATLTLVVLLLVVLVEQASVAIRRSLR